MSYGFDQSVYDLCESFFSDDDWFGKLPKALQQLVTTKCAERVQTEIEDSIEFNKPVFHRYAKADDVNWAGWYEIDGKCIGHKGLDGSFVEKKD